MELQIPLHLDPPRSLSTLSGEERWDILSYYLSHSCHSLRKIEEHFNLKYDSLGDWINTLYKKMQNTRETRELLRDDAFVRQPASIRIMRNVNSSHINELFLSLLSGDEDESLSDSEVLYVEFLVECGEDLRSIVDSGLDVGLNKDKKGTMVSYYDACRLRSFYLKRKPNVAAYIALRKQERLNSVEDGKLYIQEKLLSLIDNLESSAGPKNNTAILKAIDTLGRTFEGVFENKLTVESVNGDEALDRLIAKASKVKDIGSGELVADE